MTKVKFCGLSRQEDIEAVNRLQPEYIGFVFAKQSKRYVSENRAAALKEMLTPSIKAVGVFVNEEPALIAELVEKGIIDIIQLHGGEDEAYLSKLRKMTSVHIIQAFTVKAAEDILPVENSSADFILLDAGAGAGSSFDWRLAEMVKRPYFLAGGLTPENAGAAIAQLRPYALDVSSGIETEGKKDEGKMAAFMAAVRKQDKELNSKYRSDIYD